MTEVVHMLTAKGGSPRLVEVRLPAGEEFVWDPPVKTERNPNGAGEVEQYRDGVLVAVGTWPDGMTYSDPPPRSRSTQTSW